MNSPLLVQPARAHLPSTFERRKWYVGKNFTNIGDTFRIWYFRSYAPEIGEKNKFEIECYKLHLKLPYGDEKDKVVAGFVRDENENNKYICVSDELNIDYDTFIADSVEDAKKQVEGMLLDHWKEQIVYLEDCIDLLQNGKE